MRQGLFVILDAGSGSGRCIVFDEEGEQVTCAQSEWDMPTIPEYPDSRVFDTEKNWRILCDCTRRALGQLDMQKCKILGVGATSMREGFVLYDDTFPWFRLGDVQSVQYNECTVLETCRPGPDAV